MRLWVRQPGGGWATAAHTRARTVWVRCGAGALRCLPRWRAAPDAGAVTPCWVWAGHAWTPAAGPAEPSVLPTALLQPASPAVYHTLPVITRLPAAPGGHIGVMIEGGGQAFWLGARWVWVTDSSGGTALGARVSPGLPLAWQVCLTTTPEPLVHCDPWWW